MKSAIELHKVIIDRKMCGMCVKPYPGHPKGCPNYNHKAGCPPHTPLFGEVYDLDRPVFAIVTEFDLGAHVARMAADHPDWSDRQLLCCLYWQGTARANQTNAILSFQSEHPDHKCDRCPEAMGVNVTETLKLAGVELEWPPRKIVRHVALGAKRIAVVNTASVAGVLFPE